MPFCIYRGAVNRRPLASVYRLLTSNTPSLLLPISSPFYLYETSCQSFLFDQTGHPGGQRLGCMLSPVFWVFVCILLPLNGKTLPTKVEKEFPPRLKSNNTPLIAESGDFIELQDTENAKAGETNGLVVSANPAIFHFSQSVRFSSSLWILNDCLCKSSQMLFTRFSSRPYLIPFFIRSKMVSCHRCTCKMVIL